MLPTISPVAVLWNSDNQTLLAELKEIRAAAQVLGVNRLFLHNRQRIMDFAIKQRLPGVYAYRELVEAGGTDGRSSGRPHLKPALTDHGDVEGESFILERRFAHGNVDRLSALAAGLVAAKAEVNLCHLRSTGGRHVEQGNRPRVRRACHQRP